MSQASWSSSEDTSAVASGTDDEEHDQELFLEAYTSFKNNPSLFAVLLVGTATSPLLQASYWVRPIYEELLYASSHTYQGADVEARRASNGLAKIISGKVTSAGDQPQQTAGSCISPLTVFGRSLTKAS